MTSSSTTWHRMTGRLTLLMALLLGATFMATATPAQAADGRAATPAGELTALYVHFLDRQPDTAGWSNYMNGGLGINADCRLGVLRASYAIGASGESINRWRTPQNQAGALYAALLDRAPDSGGLQTYTNMVANQGMNFAVMSMLASDEYHNRMNRFCAGHSTTNANVLNSTRARDIAHQLTDVATTTAQACGVAVLTSSMFKLWGVPSPAIAIDAAAKLALHYAGVNKACGATYTLLNAAWYGESVAENGYNVIWVTTQWDTKDHTWSPTVTHVIVRVGTDPVDGLRYYATEFNS